MSDVAFALGSNRRPDSSASAGDQQHTGSVPRLPPATRCRATSRAQFTAKDPCPNRLFTPFGTWTTDRWLDTSVYRWSVSEGLPLAEIDARPIEDLVTEMFTLELLDTVIENLVDQGSSPG